MNAIIPNLPQIPWHTLGSDMFELNGQDYLVIADYYSKFILVEHMTTTTSRAITNCAPIFFALFGAPNTIISDNGPQYIGSDFQQLMAELGIVHITSSPHHAKSHGYIESAVKTAQLLIKKSSKDTSTALLMHRTTPLGPQQKSQAELLFNRKVATNLPIHTKGNSNVYHQACQAALQKKLEDLYNRSAKTLPELQSGQHIFYQDVAKRTWSPGEIIGYSPEPRSYTIECLTSGRRLRRNRVLLRPRQVTFNIPASSSSDASRSCPVAMPKSHENTSLTCTWPNQPTRCTPATPSAPNLPIVDKTPAAHATTSSAHVTTPAARVEGSSTTPNVKPSSTPVNVEPPSNRRSERTRIPSHRYDAKDYVT
ncbi:uncharacterized protein LOC135500160 [Lineus longissimus]|uniref:uncharacterized protein LOC135500160 n=1 Tax=Lineus longissimus TaxID=88925 RepID=UPI00315D6446